MSHCDKCGLAIQTCGCPRRPMTVTNAGGERVETMTQMDAYERCGPVSHEEANTIALKFINQHFKNPDKERPRTSIPADPTRDDDLRLMAYIRQQQNPTPPPDAAKASDDLLREVWEFVDLKMATGNDRNALLTMIGARVYNLGKSKQPDAARAVVEAAELVYDRFIRGYADMDVHSAIRALGDAITAHKRATYDATAKGGV